MSAVIRWEEPPPDSRNGLYANRRRYDHEAITRELRARPNEWAVVFDEDSSAGWPALINSGKIVAYRPAGTFEAQWRHGCTYVRFVGER